MSVDEDRDPYEYAKSQGLVVVVPEPRELFVDIDDEASLAHFEKALDIMNRDRLGKRRWSFVKTPSPSGEPHHFHIVVTMDAPLLDERVRLGLQAILGSDRVREALCWKRMEWGDHPVTCFFEVPAAEAAPTHAPAPNPVEDEADDILF